MARKASRDQWMDGWSNSVISSNIMTMPLDLHVYLALFQATLLPLPQGSGLALGQGYCLPVADILCHSIPLSPSFWEAYSITSSIFSHKWSSIPKMGSWGISTISLHSTFLPLSEYCCVSPVQSVTPYMKSLAGCDTDKTVASGEEWPKQATYGSQAGHLKARRKTSGIHFCRSLYGTWLLNVYCWHVLAIALVLVNSSPHLCEDVTCV